MYQDFQPKKYDPVKAHQYYEAHKKLKGRQSGSSKSSSSGHAPPNAKAAPKKPVKLSPRAQKIKNAQARVGRLRSAVHKLSRALSEAEAALSAKRQTARKTKQASSDGKSTVKEKTAAKNYRDKHQAEIKSKAKSSSSSSSSTSSSKSVSDMDVQELTARIIKIRGALDSAKKQLATANHELGQLAHAAITSDPNVDIHFAQFAISRKDSVT